SPSCHCRAPHEPAGGATGVAWDAGWPAAPSAHGEVGCNAANPVRCDMDDIHQSTVSDGGSAAGAPGPFAPSPFKTLVIRSEYLLQSVLKYPLAVPCPHCGSARQTLITRKYRVARIVRCADCGLGFSRPIYRSWVADNFYDELYTAGFSTTLPDES